jgi:hypothetical protein
MINKIDKSLRSLTKIRREKTTKLEIKNGISQQTPMKF